MVFAVARSGKGVDHEKHCAFFTTQIGPSASLFNPAMNLGGKASSVATVNFGKKAKGDYSWKQHK